MLSDALVEKTDFPFPSCHQLHIAFWLEVRLGIHFPVSVLGFFCLVWTCVPIVCLSQSVSHVYISPAVSENILCLESFTTSGSYSFPVSFFTDPWTCRGWELMRTSISSRDECSRISHSLVCCLALCLCVDSSHCRKLPAAGWVMHWSESARLFFEWCVRCMHHGTPPLQGPCCPQLCRRNAWVD